ncbi:hypothetical protein TRVA0_057S00320 [Trichomonascus vanleenenianus]|uniref:alpha/beta fold hydrolase n=1 Tax=Trichomonascus vanleenenianus TaxID=2268995 RepID=UPI003EC9AA98
MYSSRRLLPLIRSPSLYRQFNNAATTAPCRDARGGGSGKEDQTISLPDGRTLGYAEYGSQTGYPLLYFHGYPSSRLEGRAMDDVARRLNIRVISPDRPGFGLSSIQPHRKILDWPEDVEALASHLGLSRFALLGGSGGSPYALACAYVLPRDMLSAVGIMAGAGPWQAGSHHMLPSYRLAAWAAVNWPRGLEATLGALLWVVRTALTSRTGSKSIDNWLEKNSSNSSLTASEQRKQFIRLLLEGFAQGVEPSVHEAYLLTQDWGIPFEKVDYEPILMWHGSDDKNSPIAMVEYMADRLPHCLLHMYEGETHFTTFRHLEEILSKLVPTSHQVNDQL